MSHGYSDLANVGGGVGDSYPVMNVSWYDAVKWCNALSEMEGKTPVYQVDGSTYKLGQSAPTVMVHANGYRLPTETEWEWAARGGNKTHGYTYGGSDELNEVGWWAENSNGMVHAVGEKKSNELGIYDTSGNVWEWCFDAVDVTKRRLRGGSWLCNVAATVAVAYRGGNNWVNDNAPSLISEGVGFRLARSLELVAVKGGTLPSGSRFAGQAVSDFQIGEYEVTWGEWKTVRDWAVENGYSDLVDTGVGGGDNYPVTAVSWYNALKWCNARSEKEGLRPVYTVGGFVYRTKEVVPDENMWVSGYRLPKEAEWEFAAGGGNMGHGYAYSGGNNLELLGWYAGDYRAAIHECGAKLPNELGIYDMCGNTWEWCFDAFSDSMRVHKGGHFYDVFSSCLVNVRQGGSPQFRESGSGFRVVRSTLSGMVPVQGGTLPDNSALKGQVVGDFQIGKTEVTWGEWKAVRDWAMHHGYSDLNVGAGTLDNYPVTSVTWYDVVKWCNAKSEKEGKVPVYRLKGETYKTGQGDYATVETTVNGYRLPTEVEWEWAARGGRQTHGYTYSGSNDWNTVASWTGDNSISGTKEVGKKAANELGLYDMSGNVWEWCWDLFSGSWSHFYRGGSWRSVDYGATVSSRGYLQPDYGFDSVGFRLACNSGQ